MEIKPGYSRHKPHKPGNTLFILSVTVLYMRENNVLGLPVMLVWYRAKRYKSIGFLEADNKIKKGG